MSGSALFSAAAMGLLRECDQTWREGEGIK